MERIGLYTFFDRPLSEEERGAYRTLVKRRFAGEPSQYLTGKQEFWSLSFKVSPAVLVPRPDTEVLVEEALSFLESQGRAGRVLDVGTGSGAVAIALAHECPDAEVFACDVSADALVVAGENGASNEVNVSWIEGRANQALGEGPFDILVSNPPYIPTGTLDTLMREVRDYEPHLALDGGVDGLLVFREILNCADELVKPGGWIGFEVEGERQAGEVKALLLESGAWESLHIRLDYSGLQRVVSARRVG
jgi:release factor glutamine methyltransferase